MRRTPLAGGSGPARRTRVAPRSPKRQADMVERRALVAQLLAETPRCQARVVCSGAPSVDVHERLTRARGGSILDPAQGHMVTICRPCHDWVGANVAAATSLRLLLPSWHQCPPAGPC